MLFSGVAFFTGPYLGAFIPHMRACDVEVRTCETKAEIFDRRHQLCYH